MSSERAMLERVCHANSRLRIDLDREIERNEELTKAISKISSMKLAVEESMRVEREVGIAMRDLAYVHGMKCGWNLSDNAEGRAQLQRATEVAQRSSLAVLRQHGRLTVRSPAREGGQRDE